ncbi:MAG TPA: helix-turn-helix transcriptional regulator [Trueperaceae bacterium]|nr:helix-turn-helix transcriptional regulator [Trueperaceae bacterium]
MSGLRFRNLDADPADPVETWPTEGVIAALERGDIRDWRRIAVAVSTDPWGPVARRLEDALAAIQPYGVGPLMQAVLEHARSAAEAHERSEVARRVTALLAASGMSRAEFAERIGTSTSRLSTYLSGKVAPASTLLLRMERVAGSGT